MAAPTLADLKDWRVVTSIDVAANDAAGKIDASVGKPRNSKLTRKQRSELLEKSRSTAATLAVIGKGLAKGTEVGATDSNRGKLP